MDHCDEMEICSNKGDVLETTTSHKLLGVYIDPDLSFNEQVEHLCKKLTKRIGVLRSIRHYLHLNEHILFYNATIKPLFLYGREVWRITSKANIRRVFRLQKRAARVILMLKQQGMSELLTYLISWTGCPSMKKSMLISYALSLNVYMVNAENTYLVSCYV